MQENNQESDNAMFRRDATIQSMQRNVDKNKWLSIVFMHILSSYAKMGGNAIRKSHKSKGGSEERKYKMKPINRASTSRWFWG